MTQDMSPDILVLVGAAGGASPSGDSAKLIRRQLNKALESSFVEIKVSAKTGAALKDIDELGKRIDAIKGNKASGVDFTSTLRAIETGLREVKSALDPITKAILTEGSAFNRMGKEGSASLDTLIDKLSEIKTLVDSLSKKDFGLNFNISANKDIADNILAYREQATLYANAVRDVQKIIRPMAQDEKLFSVITNGKVGGEEYNQLYKFAHMTSTEIDGLIRRLGSFKSPASISETVQQLETMYDAAIKLLKALDDAGERSYKGYSRKYDSFAGLQVPVFSEALAEEKDKAEDQVGEIKNSLAGMFGGNDVGGKLVEQISVDIAEIRKQLESVFSLEDVDPKLEKVKEITSTIYDYFKEVSDKIKKDFAGIGDGISEEIEKAASGNKKKRRKKSGGGRQSDKQANQYLTDARQKIVELEARERSLIARGNEEYAGAVSGVISSISSGIESDLKKYQELKNLTDEETDAVRKQLTAHQSVQKAVNDTTIASAKSSALEGKKYDDLLAKAQGFYNKLQRLGVESSNPQYMQALKSFIDQLSSSGHGSFNGALDAAKVKYAELVREAEKLNLTTETFGHSLSRMFSEKLGYGILGVFGAKARQAISGIYTNIVNIDSAMTELKKVTNETSAEYTRFLERASDRAEKLGVALVDVVSATADFARLGYSMEDASNLADAAVIYKHVGDGIQDINEASTTIISAMRAFGIEADDAMSIVDKYNEVGKTIARR